MPFVRYIRQNPLQSEKVGGEFESRPNRRRGRGRSDPASSNQDGKGAVWRQSRSRLEPSDQIYFTRAVGVLELF